MHRGNPINTRAVRIGILSCTICAVAGCVVPSSTIRLVDYLESGEHQTLGETFPECYYSVDGFGNIDVVLRRIQPARDDPRASIRQVVHIRTVWRSIPGKTTAERTQINGLIRYHIDSPSGRALLEGAGSVFLYPNEKNDRLTGGVDFAILRPTIKQGDTADIFHNVELSARFRATRDPRRTVRIANDLERWFATSPLAQAGQPMGR